MLTRRFSACLLLAALALGAPHAFAQQFQATLSVPVYTGTPVYSAPITVTSTVTTTVPPSEGVPNGTITFTVNNVKGAPQPIVNGAASISLNSLTPGTQVISASYGNDGNFWASSSGTLTVLIDKASSALTVTPNAAQLGQSVSIRAVPALLSPATGTATGTVDFLDGGTSIPGCVALPVQNGAAVCNTSFSQLGTYDIFVNYSGDSNTKPSSFVTPLTVGKALAGMSIATTPNAPLYGTPVTIGVLLTGALGVAAPTGTVSFSMGGATLPSASVGADGRASLLYPGLLSAGTYQVTASYSGDSIYQSLSSLPLSFTVAKEITTLALTSTPAALGQAVTLTATLTIAGGTPNGTVSMTNGSTSICSGVALPNGIATCTTPPLQAGTNTITATYSGDVNTAASTATLALTATKSAAGITTAFAPSAPVYGAPVTIVATLAGATGQAAPTGTVTFSDVSAGLGTFPVGADGHATLVSSTLAVGTHSIVAVYNGDTNYQGMTAAAVNIVVGKAATSVVLAPNTAPVAQAVTLTAAVTVVSPGSGTPGGTVDFSSGGKAIAGCTGVAVQNGSAPCSTSFSQAGSYTIAANYNGDANTAASTASLTLTAGKAAAGITAVFTPAAPVYGAPVTITAAVTSAAGQPAPTGTVAFTDGTTGLGVANLGADGHASVAVTLNVGTHGIVAIYSGDANNQPATAAAVSIVVAKAATSTALSSNTAQAGQSVTLTAAVTVVSPGSGTPGGTVDFSSGAKAIAGCTGIPVQNGSAVCSTSFPQAGSYTLAAGYNGDANTAASTASLTLALGKAAAGIAAAFTPAAPVYGAAVTITATLAGATGQALPTGTVTFSDGSASLGTASVGTDGHALVVAGALAVGTHSIVAAYGGDATYQAATAAALSIVVGKAATSVALTSNTAQIGQSVTLTAAVTVVSPGSGTPGGTVDFTSGGKAIAGCTGIAVQNGIAVCTTSFSQLGNPSIAASYNGDGNTTAGAATLVLAVGKAVPGIYTAATLSAPPYGAAVTVNALLMGATGLPTPSGTVAFADGATALATVTLGSDGKASLTLGNGAAAALSVGAHSIAAVYSGDSNYQTTTAAALAIVVAKAATSVALASTPAQIDQPVNLKAAVTVVSPGSAALGGSVDFSNGGKAIAGCVGMVLQNGAAACTTAFSQLGTYTIGATYNGDANTAPGTATFPVIVGKAAAGIYTAFTPGAPVYGASVSINALLLGATGLSTPTGTVMYSDGGTPLAAMPVGADGRASLVLPSATLPPLGAGSHSVVAAYSGDANYVMSSADPLLVTVAKASTSTVLTSSASGTLTATVTVVAPGAGTPTGSVQFYQAGTQIGGSGLTSQGSGFVATLAAGSQSGSLWAVYQGDSNFNGSTSPVVTVAGRVQVSISADHNPAAFGQAVTFTVRVSAGSGTGTPSGSVQLSADGAAAGTGTLVAGQATVIATLAAGSHTITANYSGDAVYAAGSATMQQVVNKAAMTLSLASTAATTVFGQPLTLSATLGNQASGATVQFLDGTAVIGSAQVSSGVATLTVATLAVGVHSIQATWAGDANSAAVASAVLPETVNQAQTSTTLAVSGSTLTATVAVTAPGAGLPTGSVKFLDSTTNAVLGSAPLAGSNSSIAMPSASNAIIAIYSGDTNFQTSTSSPLVRVTAVNAASYSVASFAPDEIATLFGTNLATATKSATGPPAASLGGTSVSITDSAGAWHAAALLFVSPGQLSFLMPSDTATGPATVTVTNGNGVATPTTILVARVAPGLFTMNSTGQGVAAAQVLRVHADGSQDAPQDVAAYDQAKSQWVAAPINLGVSGDVVYLLLYGTGIRHYSAMPLCTIGGQTTAAMFAGAQGAYAGLDQVNVALPQSLRGKGSVDLTLTVDGTASNTVTLAFQ